jgi:folate-binding Fe-S cluster repair protein YgfZ
VTKDVSPLEVPNSAPVYAAILNTKGRLMSDLLLHRADAQSPQAGVLVDCPAALLPQLKTVLTKFKLRSDVIVDDASEDLSIVARWSIGWPSISDINLPDPPGAQPCAVV